jgi:hypothetical protein
VHYPAAVMIELNDAQLEQHIYSARNAPFSQESTIKTRTVSSINESEEKSIIKENDHAFIKVVINLCKD